MPAEIVNSGTTRQPKWDKIAVDILFYLQKLSLRKKFRHSLKMILLHFIKIIQSLSNVFIVKTREYLREVFKFFCKIC